MTDKAIFIKQLEDNLKQNILPYWMNMMVDPSGGFYGRRDGLDNLIENSVKGCVLNARILWTFSAAYGYFGQPEYKRIAARAMDYMLEFFVDHKNGGVFWSVNADGTPHDTKKQFYAMAFAIYGFSQYYAVSGDRRALQTAVDLFGLIEQHSLDTLNGGYVEALSADWTPVKDMRLSDKDANASKTMNTHLHILEGYTGLLKVWRSPRLEEAVGRLLDIFANKIVRPDGHLGLFFSNDWQPLDDIQSFGHDIEASWLLLEAVHVLGDEARIPVISNLTERIAMAGLEGLRTDSSMDYERDSSGLRNHEKHWWVQAESVVGQIYLYRYHRCMPALHSAWYTWRYIRDNMVDYMGGEWYWSLIDGEINRKEDKAGFWKCPYHNSRMCLEVITQLSKDGPV